jgi:glucan biosynthesis protein C
MSRRAIRTQMSDGGRLYFLDNIRWSMIVLVLLVHAAVTYGPISSWFYHDTGGADGLFNVVLTIVPGLLQTFFMGLLFFVAGYLVPASLERKGPGKYVFGRAVRLGVPALLFMLVLSPIIYVMVHGTAVLFSLPSYLLSPLDWDSGPLWFALALLLFTLVYVGWARHGHGSEMFRAPPTNAIVLLLVLTIITATVAVRVFYPIGTAVWNM